MKKRKGLIILSAALVLGNAIPVYGASTVSELPRLVDNADLLTEEEEAEISARLDEVSDDQACDVVIVTTDSLDGKTATEYADDYFDYNGYGQGEDRSGILFLVSMEERDWALSTHGEAIYVFTDAGQKYITDQVIPELSNANYEEAFLTYVSYCDAYLTQAKEGNPYDSGNLPKRPIPLWAIPAALVIGFVLALIVTGIMRAKLKSVHSKPEASDYLRDGSFELHKKRDIYLYSTLTKKAKPKENQSSGSSTHRSSSGSYHGGSSGKF